MEEEVAAVLLAMLEDLPRVTAKKHVGHMSFLTGPKVFAFTRAEGVAMKLPKEKIQSLAARKDITPLVMGKRTMKEWVVLTRKTPTDYKNELDLFITSAEFAATSRR